jgi:superfamily II DNA helicase RecQ
VQKIIQESSEQ